jgi:hypothetical protein
VVKRVFHLNSFWLGVYMHRVSDPAGYRRHFELVVGEQARIGSNRELTLASIGAWQRNFSTKRKHSADQEIRRTDTVREGRYHDPPHARAPGGLYFACELSRAACKRNAGRSPSCSPIWWASPASRNDLERKRRLSLCAASRSLWRCRSGARRCRTRLYR